MWGGGGREKPPQLVGQGGGEAQRVHVPLLPVYLVIHQLQVDEPSRLSRCAHDVVCAEDLGAVARAVIFK